jgi:proline dehydrogenase
MTPTQPSTISFDNTAFAFEYKSDKELKKAHFLFSTMGKPFLVNLGVTLMPMAVKMKFPFVKSIVRNTIFKQFVGGETLEQTAPVANKLEKYKVQVILDYGVEGGEGEAAFDEATAEFIKVIEYAGTQSNIPFISIKVTGIARFGLLESLDNSMHNCNELTLMKKYYNAVENLSDEEKNEWHKCVSRLLKICDTAHKKNIAVLVDAEESWIQDPVDALTILMMDSFNKEKVVVFNTIQLYRHDRFEFLKSSFSAAVDRNFILGAKLVRGAYMEKERLRASENGYLSPIQKDKESSDKDYNAALEFCIQHIERVSVIVASHNEQSNLLATTLMSKKGIPASHEHVHFSQLYGMSDNITFNLAKHGYSVSKYLPFGPIKDVVPYLMRRARENSSVAGQTGRELGLIKRELERRSAI